MEQKVEIPRVALASLVLALVVCLVAVAFLLGRESAQPEVALTPAPAARLAASTADPSFPEETTEPARPFVGGATRGRPQAPARAPSTQDVVKAEADAQPARLAVRSEVETEVRNEPRAGRPDPVYPRAAKADSHSASVSVNSATVSINSGGARVDAGSPSSAKEKPPADSQAVRSYLSKVDKAMAGTQSMDDASGFATQLLQQSMQGDTSGFDQLIATSESALQDLKAIKPPARCKEHHKLMIGQLNDGLGLLRKVKTATTSMDTTALSSLSLQGKDLQADTARLQELDRELRANI